MKRLNEHVNLRRNERAQHINIPGTTDRYVPFKIETRLKIVLEKAPFLSFPLVDLP